jgi:membrane protein required for colicin V production
MATITATDWILAAVLLASLVMGAWRGLVYEVMSVIGWLAAFVLAQWFAAEVAVHLPMQSAGASLRYAAGFVIVFVASVFTAGLISALLRKLISVIGLRPVDRLLGAGFGLFRGLILLLALTVVLHLTSLAQSDWWQNSQGGPVLSSLLKGLKPILPADFGAYLPD